MMQHSRLKVYYFLALCILAMSIGLLVSCSQPEPDPPLVHTQAPETKEIPIPTITPTRMIETSGLANVPYPTTHEGFVIDERTQEQVLEAISQSYPEEFEWMRTVIATKLWRDQFTNQLPESTEALYDWFQQHYQLEGVQSDKAWAVAARDKESGELLVAWQSGVPLLQLMPVTVPIGDFEAVDGFELKPIDFGEGLHSMLVADVSGHVLVAGFHTLGVGAWANAASGQIERPGMDLLQIKDGELWLLSGLTYTKVEGIVGERIEEGKTYWTVFKDEAPSALYLPTTNEFVPVTQNRVMIDKVPYVWDGTTFVDAFYQVENGFLTKWENTKYSILRTPSWYQPGTYEQFKADLLMPLPFGGLAVVENNKIVAHIDASRRFNDVRYPETNKFMIDRGDGWFYAWDKESQTVADAVQVRDGAVWQWYWDKYRLVEDGDNQPVKAEGIKAAGGQYGWVVESGNQMTAYLNREGLLLPAFNNQVPVGYSVVAWENGSLVDTGKTPLELMITMPGHETVYSTGIGPEISVTVVEKAIGLDVSFEWHNESNFRKYWLGKALDRMKEDGHSAVENMSLSDFEAWLEAGNTIVLEVLDAINARTGRSVDGLFRDVPVERIRVYLSYMDLKNTGVPLLPVEGNKSRFSPGGSHAFKADDAVYDPVTATLYLITEGNSNGWGALTRTPSNALSYMYNGASTYLRVPYSVFQSNLDGTTTSDGRINYSIHADLRSGYLFQQYVLNDFPLRLRVKGYE
jgi:hypothetical protein